MGRKTDTRERVLDTAAELFQTQGYSGTGLNTVLARSGAPKGSLYFHFPEGKTQLAVEAIARSSHGVEERISAVLATAAGAEEAVVALGEFFAAGLEESEYRKGCPVATVALEAADDDDIRAACASAYRSWQEMIAEALCRWDIDPERAAALASLVLSAIQGALVLARTHRDASLVRSAARQVGVLARPAVD
ncbi:TetR/AcrR family transcriptional regulator [Nocardia panacis]|uniref:TetR/AcrR family transcriptional regulator n=1 Tax=Nocardia panacis TaxID=2340916 RepID=A0A3A4K1U5_9NOCA|nr:TetR/AcrR family transcriptional regulator [Nocardia panacis]RJO70107.1 TetR/AcrR family transcriptional regulator [Nocardia panacis]